MVKSCCDSYHTQFSDFSAMLSYHEQVRKSSLWERTEVKKLQVAALDKTSPLYEDTDSFDPSVSRDAVEDTAENLKLAIKLRDKFFPLRDTAYKSLLDRAKIGGSALPKLSREKLADVINACLALHKDNALLLIRDEKVSAAHSGDSRDYSVLEIDQLLDGLQSKMDERFPGNQFSAGYVDHAITSASWTLPGQREELLDTYIKLLAAEGKSSMAAKLMPGIRFSTSDTGMASAKVSALLVGLQYPIHIGGMIAVEHRRQSKVPDFVGSLDMLFAQFGDSVARLTSLLSVHLDHPVNAMTAVCKRLALPKKAALEAISMFEMAVGNDEATAHDVFVAMQEIPFTLKTQGIPESKLLALQENMARALTINWRDYNGKTAWRFAYPFWEWRIQKETATSSDETPGKPCAAGRTGSCIPGASQPADSCAGSPREFAPARIDR